MTKEEMLDQIAIAAMSAQIQKLGINNTYTLAQTSYRVAQDMMENRGQIHAEWKREEELQLRYATADLHELELPMRYRRCLMSEGVYTKAALSDWDIRDLRKIPNMGLKGVTLIREAMEAAGLKLKGQQ